MISLKRTKAQAKKDSGEVASTSFEEYSYGTQISFEKPEIDKISSLQGVKVGDSVNIHAIGTVTSMSESERVGGDDSKSVGIRIEKIDVDSESEETKGFDDDDDD